MQQHLGQHILSACFAELFEAHTIGFHLGIDYVSIDLDCFLEPSQIQEAQTLSNEIIFDHIPVEILYPTKAELKKLPLKKALPKTTETIRLVKIGDLDLNPCCGTHHLSTLEVQVIKIIKWEKYKMGMRIQFLCGKRALNDYFSKDAFAFSICTMLKCTEKDALIKIEKLTQDVTKLLSENRNLKSEIADYEVGHILSTSEKIGKFQVVQTVYDTIDVKHATLLASKLTASQGVIVLFGVQAQDMAHLIFMCSKEIKKVHMGSLLKDAITLIDGKGGGSNFCAQGGGKSISNLSSSIEYAFMKIKQTLNK